MGYDSDRNSKTFQFETAFRRQFLNLRQMIFAALFSSYDHDKSQSKPQQFFLKIYQLHVSV